MRRVRWVGLGLFVVAACSSSLSSMGVLDDDPGDAGAAPDASSSELDVTSPPADAGPDAIEDAASEAAVDGGNPDHLLVPGGTFYRFTLDDGGLDSPATVSTFRLDRFEVTVGRYKKFVEAWKAGWRPAAGSGKHAHLRGGLGLEDSQNPGTYETGWVTADEAKVQMPEPPDATTCATYMTGGKGDEMPMRCITQLEAFAFCIWDGGFLPSEAEWRFAARGGTEHRYYPWGSADADITRAIFGTISPEPVGTADAGAGKWGHLDLAGNVGELTADWWLDQAPLPCVDCAVLSPPPVAVWVTAGGSMNHGEEHMRTSTRYGFDKRATLNGVRCASSP